MDPSWRGSPDPGITRPHGNRRGKTAPLGGEAMEELIDVGT